MHTYTLPTKLAIIKISEVVAAIALTVAAIALTVVCINA
jgi:hypothetical protein